MDHPDGRDWVVDIRAEQIHPGRRCGGCRCWKPTATVLRRRLPRSSMDSRIAILRNARNRYESLYRKNFPQEVRRRALLATMHACQAELESVQAKLNAERTRYIEGQSLPSEVIEKLSSQKKSVRRFLKRKRTSPTVNWHCTSPKVCQPTMQSELLISPRPTSPSLPLRTHCRLRLLTPFVPAVTHRYLCNIRSKAQGGVAPWQNGSRRPKIH